MYKCWLDLKEISKLSKLKGSEINVAKKILAYEVTKICRNKKEADSVLEMSQKTFEEKIIDERLKSYVIKRKNFLKDVSIIDILITLKFIKTRGEGKRLIKGGGVKIKNQTILKTTHTINKDDFKDNNTIKVACGKKKIGVIKVIN